MRASTIVATALVAASPSLASALTYGGNAIIVNQCDYPLNVWSVDQTFFPTDNDRQTIAPHSNWSEPLRVPAAGCNCGVSIKISKGETYARPIVQFEYTIAEASSRSNMFQSYDISFVDCSESTPQIAAVNGYSSFTGKDCPAWDEGIKIYGTGSDCPTMSCPAGEFCPYDAYFEPEPKNLNGPQPVRQCPHGDLSSDIVFVTCSDKQASSDDTPASSSPSSSSPAYTPSSTPTPSSTSSSAVVTPAVFAQITDAPKAADVSTNGNVVVQVVWVTAYVDEYGVRVNEDGSKYLGRRFMA